MVPNIITKEKRARSSSCSPVNRILFLLSAIDDCHAACSCCQDHQCSPEKNILCVSGLRNYCCLTHSPCARRPNRRSMACRCRVRCLRLTADLRGPRVTWMIRFSRCTRFSRLPRFIRSGRVTRVVRSTRIIRGGRIVRSNRVIRGGRIARSNRDNRVILRGCFRELDRVQYCSQK